MYKEKPQIVKNDKKSHFTYVEVLKGLVMDVNYFRIEKDILRNKEYYREILNQFLKQRTIFHVLLINKRFSLFKEISHLVDYKKADNKKLNVLGLCIERGLTNELNIVSKDIKERNIPFDDWAGKKVSTMDNGYGLVGYMCESTLLCAVRKGSLSVIDVFEMVTDKELPFEDSIKMFDILVGNIWAVSGLISLSYELNKKYKDVTEVPNDFLRLVFCIEGYTPKQLERFMTYRSANQLEKYSGLIAKMEELMIKSDSGKVLLNNKPIKL